MKINRHKTNIAEPSVRISTDSREEKREKIQYVRIMKRVEDYHGKKTYLIGREFPINKVPQCFFDENAKLSTSSDKGVVKIIEYEKGRFIQFLQTLMSQQKEKEAEIYTSNTIIRYEEKPEWLDEKEAIRNKQIKILEY